MGIHYLPRKARSISDPECYLCVLHALENGSIVSTISARFLRSNQHEDYAEIVIIQEKTLFPGSCRSVFPSEKFSTLHTLRLRNLNAASRRPMTQRWPSEPPRHVRHLAVREPYQLPNHRPLFRIERSRCLHSAMYVAVTVLINCFEQGISDQMTGSNRKSNLWLQILWTILDAITSSFERYYATDRKCSLPLSVPLLPLSRSMYFSEHYGQEKVSLV